MIMTTGERIALIGLIVEYLTESRNPTSQLSQRFTVIDTEETFTPFELLEIVREHPVVNPDD
jgi:hypothetical protein